jgi:hypothetical protein
MPLRRVLELGLDFWRYIGYVDGGDDYDLLRDTLWTVAPPLYHRSLDDLVTAQDAEEAFALVLCLAIDRLRIPSLADRLEIAWMAREQAHEIWRVYCATAENSPVPAWQLIEYDQAVVALSQAKIGFSLHQRKAIPLDFERPYSTCRVVNIAPLCTQVENALQYIRKHCR